MFLIEDSTAVAELAVLQRFHIVSAAGTDNRHRIQPDQLPEHIVGIICMYGCRNRIFVEFVVYEIDVNIGVLSGNLHECIGERCMIEAVAELLRKGGSGIKHHHEEYN